MRMKWTGSMLGFGAMSAALLLTVSSVGEGLAQNAATPDKKDARCNVDLRLAGKMKDIVSNALLLSAGKSEDEVRKFLDGAEKKYATGEDLMRAAAAHFKIDESKMAAEVERFRHVICDHEPGAAGRDETKGKDSAGALELLPFARDVALHAVLHEMGHALIREFDLPVLANEETMADAFATHFLTQQLPDRALDALCARTRSLMIEAGEVPREQWPINGEHNHDARRAFQIAALAIAADAAKYAPVARIAGMTDSDIRKAKDYGPEIHRSWRRTLAPLMMPAGMKSKEARVICDGQVFAGDSAASLMAELESAIARFDWHSQVKIEFVTGEGGASWSRGKRTITVNSRYLQRFLNQGRVAASQPAAH